VGVRSAVAEGLILCERIATTGQASEAVRVNDTAEPEPARPTTHPRSHLRRHLARQAEGLPLLLETLSATDRDTFGIGLRAARELPGRPVTEALAAE
jgi:hypothetical protein